MSIFNRWIDLLAYQNMVIWSGFNAYSNEHLLTGAIDAPTMVNRIGLLVLCAVMVAWNLWGAANAVVGGRYWHFRVAKILLGFWFIDFCLEICVWDLVSNGSSQGIQAKRKRIEWGTAINQCAVISYGISQMFRWHFLLQILGRKPCSFKWEVTFFH